MKKLTDLKENEVIHCPTKKQWKKILALNPENRPSICEWEMYKENICYFPKGNNGNGTYADLDYFKRNDYTIHKAKDFLPKKNKLKKIENRLDKIENHLSLNTEVSVVSQPKWNGEFEVGKKYIYSGAVVVLCTDGKNEKGDFSGVCINENKFWNKGHYSTGWSLEVFTPYNEPITI